jgi:ABC-2 type transport system permease protein
VALLCGSAIVYSFWLILATMAFWFIRIENILMIFWSMYTAGRWPVGIYPGWLRWTLTLIVPVAFAVTVPAQAISGRLEPETLLGGISLAIALLTLSRWFWKQGLKHYSGASA